jgi:hypothetical protein
VVELPLSGAGFKSFTISRRAVANRQLNKEMR